MHVGEWPVDWLTVVTAKSQTAGKGQRGRHWRSPPSDNLAITLCFVTPSYYELKHIGQVAALSTIQALEPTGLTVHLKLPNDLRINRKKLAGILCETRPLDQGIGVIVGIGINVNTSPEFLAEIDQPATSLLVEVGAPQNLEVLQKRLVSNFNRDLIQFETEGFSPFELRLKHALEIDN